MGDSKFFKLSRRDFFKAVGVVGTGLALSGPSMVWSAHKEVKVVVMQSPMGSGPWTCWSIIQNHAKKWHTWLRPIVQETPGFTYNLKYMSKTSKKWKDTVFGSGTVLHWAAEYPWKSFFPKPLGNVRDFKVLGYQSLAANFFVTLDPKIKTPKDFVDKRIGVGLTTQNEWGMHPMMLMEYWGLMKKIRSLSNLGTGPNIKAMLDGRTDVGFLFMPYTLTERLITPPQQNLATSSRKYYFVQVPPEMVTGFNKEYGANFNAITLPANFMPNQPEPLHTFGDKISLVAHKTFPEDVAYEFVKFWVENRFKLAKLHAWGKVVDPKVMSAGAMKNPGEFHPGALRYYKEIGLV